MRRVVGVVVILLALGIAFSGVAFLHQGSFRGLPFTGMASDGLLFLCINDPPEVNFSCLSSFNQSTALVDNTVSCKINASDPDNDSLSLSIIPDMPGNWTWINSSGFLFLRPFQPEVGLHNIQIRVQDASGCANGQANTSYQFTVLDINDPPELVENVTDVEFNQGSSLSPYSLYEFFDDPDNDPLNFSVIGNIVASITITQSTGLVFLSATGCGTDYVLFRATDPYNLSEDSNLVRVRVICRGSDEDTDGSGSGSGSGSFYPCTPKWKCNQWSECLPNGSRYKECIDLHGCKPNDYKRVFWEECEYVPTCFDGIQNQGETGVDCGGPCRPCGTCFDGIQNNDEEGVDCGGTYCEACYNCTDGVINWDETGVDCGGPFCPACPSCFDGVQNQNETGIDCGGPCPPCTIREMPGIIGQRSPLTVLIVLLAVVFAVMLVLFRLYHKQVMALAARVALYVTRQHRKQVLLSDKKKRLLLERLAAVKRAVREMERPVSVVVEEAVGVARAFFHCALDVPLTCSWNEFVPAVEEQVRHNALQKVFLSFFRMVGRYERVARERSYVDADLLIEELRVLVLQTSDATPEDMVHEVTEKEVSGSVLERFKAGFFNVLLALQFEELPAAKKQYVTLVSLYEHMDERQKGLVYHQLSRAYHSIKYLASWARS
ncbi:hypothetical protein GF367_04465 [Candidatus Woesearchaeota archaeon]|nr:hypothetical protein [Candidatus Woesearchaeota archaeon]